MTPTLMFIFPVTLKKKKNCCAFNKSGVNFHVKSFYFWISLEGKKNKDCEQIQQESDCRVTVHIQLAKNLFNLKDTLITCQIFIQRHI